MKRTSSSRCLVVPAAAVVVMLAAESSVRGQDVTLWPIDDMADNRKYVYFDPGVTGAQELDGGLYPGMTNVLTDESHGTHISAGEGKADAIEPLDDTGAPDPDGKIVFASIGFSFTKQMFAQFIPLSNEDTNRRAGILCRNGAQAGKNLDDHTEEPDIELEGNIWHDIVADIESGVGDEACTRYQVQAIWWLHGRRASDSAPFNETLADRIDRIAGLAETVANHMQSVFPNLKVAYVGTPQNEERIAGEEPYVYELGFAFRRLLEWQISQDWTGHPNLDYSASPPKAPWLKWGPYAWANHSVSRGDGLRWLDPDDYGPPGPGGQPNPHLNAQGNLKVARMLDHFVRTDPNAIRWYDTSPPAWGRPADVELYGGKGVEGSLGEARMHSFTHVSGVDKGRSVLPQIPQSSSAPLYPSIHISASLIPVGSSCVLFLGTVPRDPDGAGFGGGSLLVESDHTLDPAFVVRPFTYGVPPNGTDGIAFDSIAFDPQLQGVDFYAQIAYIDAGLPSSPTVFTGGLKLILGD